MAEWVETAFLTVGVLAAGFVAFTYAGFPLLLIVLAHFRHKDRVSGSTSVPEEALPHVQVVVSCYNEGRTIRGRIRNVLEQRYPRDRLSVLVIDDGSTDETAGAVEGLQQADARIRLFRLAHNLGKNNAINAARASGELVGDVICFTDADCAFAAGAVRNGVQRMAMSRIGLVGGKVQYVLGDGAAQEAEGLYWRMENRVRMAEGKLGMLIAAPGAMVFVRADLLERIPADANTDFSLPLSVLCQGYGCAYAPDAVVTTAFPARQSNVLRRRWRTIVRALRTIAYYKKRLPRLARWALFWHKTARFYLAAPAGVLLGASVYASFVVPSVEWRAALAAQTAFYLAAAAGQVAGLAGIRFPLVGVAHQFVTQHVLALGAVIAFAAGHRVSRWNPSRD